MDPLPSPSRKPTIAEMLNPSQATGTPVSAPEPRRRQSLAQMLRESSLVGNEVPLAEALGASQAADRSKNTPAENSPAEAEKQIHRYSLYLKVQGKWIWQGDVQAAAHADALRQAAGLLNPQHDALPIRLEQDEATNGQLG
ncbi:MAG: hypothetical protein JWN24_1445 [Phycisphaerales bacterium]|nr:hypothetical protein [Phycisphaerales bacterium]